MSVLALVLVTSLVGLTACDRNRDEGEEPSAATSVPAPDAFCIEHGVAEAVCTKCNPKLISIFQAKGDWCEEHGLPESFCPICHPERGGRPTANLDSDGPADGTRVQLASPETARLAGITTTNARTQDIAEELDVLGTITYDATKRAEVNARVRGVVRAVYVEVGARVEQGTPLVQIESAEIGAEQSRLIAANSRIEVARAGLERTKALFDKGMSAERALQEAQLEFDTALAERAATQAALGIVGVDASSGSSFTVTAPLAGTCIRRAATIGRMVSAEEVLYEIVDTRSMWADLDVPEAQLARVRPGQEVVVRADMLDEHEFHGRIDFVAPEIDPRTRTAKARVRLENPDGALRANLFVRARIELGPKEARVIVPRGALQLAKDAQLVFVELAPGQYETRRVRTIGSGADFVALRDGVAAGERVVVEGSFLLKTETLKGAIGAGCCAEE